MTTASDKASSRLRIRDLGPLLVEENGQARQVPKGRLANALALLTVHAGRRVGHDALADAMWGDRTGARSASTLDSHVLRLRKILEPERVSRQAPSVLISDAGGYRLLTEPDQVDSLRFARLAVDAADLLAQGAADRALRRTEEALGSWRGRPYGDAADEQWAGAAVGRLEELHAQVVETHIGALVATSANDRALAELETALAENPLRERLWAYRMTALGNTGRRADALDAYAMARSTLVEELGLEPGPELRELHIKLLSDGPSEPRRRSPAQATAAPNAVHLPAFRNRILGREREIAALTDRVTRERLVTLAGAAGCGKTRLSVEIARRVAPAFDDGAWFVDLTSATPDRVLDVVCSTVELAAPASGNAVAGLRSFTRDRRMLLILDNCEHVLDAAAELIDQLFLDDGETAVLATSREPLEIANEYVHPLEPLATEPAAELFLDRLGRAPEDGDAEIAVQIATAVDGVPLALELAAGRARAYSLSEIAAQVRADASTLSRVGRGRGTHHATIRGAIDSSYRALSAPEAAMHRALGVVPGPFTAGLAAALAGVAIDDATDIIAGLVHRSLLTPLGSARPDGPSRFAQLATIRGHALHQAGDTVKDYVSRRDGWIARLAQAQPELGSARQAGWYRALDDDLAALRATLQHTLIEAPSDAGIATIARLTLFWTYNGPGVEGLHWFRTAADLCARETTVGHAADRALLHVSIGHVLTMYPRHHDAGRDHLRIGMAEGRNATGSAAELLCAELAVATGAAGAARDAVLAAELATAVREIATHNTGLDVLARQAELIANFLADPTPALFDEGVALHALAWAADNRYSAYIGASMAALLAVHAGNGDAAVPLARKAIVAVLDIGQTQNFYLAEVLGCALAARGDIPAAARVLAHAEAQHVRNALPWPTLELTEVLSETVSAVLSRTDLEQARVDATHLTLADLVDDFIVR